MSNRKVRFAGQTIKNFRSKDQGSRSTFSHYFGDFLFLEKRMNFLHLMSILDDVEGLKAAFRHGCQFIKDKD